MELRDLEFITRIAEYGNVTKAAASIGIDASTLSRHLSALEDELAVPLFERGRGGMVPTAAGRSVLHLAARTMGDVAAIRQAASRASTAATGELRLATQTATLGPRFRSAIAAWRSAHPGVAIELHELDDRELVAAMRERRVDVAAVYGVRSPDLCFQDLWDERLLLAVPDGHPLASEHTVSWVDVRSDIVMVRGARSSDALRDTHVRLLGSGVDIRLQYCGSLDMLNLVAIREGVAIFCDNHREIAFPGVRYLDIDDTDAAVGVSLAWRADFEDPVAGSFVAFMRDASRQGPASAAAC